MYVLGISAWYHDSAACLIQDGEIIAAAQEERFSRIKHDSNFPSQAIKYCLREANISTSAVANVVFYDKPFLKFERLLETYLAFAPRGFESFSTSMPLWIKDKLFQKTNIKKALKEVGFAHQNDDLLLFSEHHLSHAASAFYPSPFSESAVLTLDGVGEWSTTSLALGNKNSLQVIKEIHFPHSLGLLYSAFTYFTGFKVNSGEYKLMGLAPYGVPKYVNTIRDNIIDVADDGSFHLNMDYFDYCTGLTMTNQRFADLFGGVRRKPESELTQREMDLAASVQEVVEDVVLKLGKDVRKTTGLKNLCLAGGVALNCVAKGKLLKKNFFDNIWVQPAAGDAGGAVGAALVGYHIHHGKQRRPLLSGDSMKGSYLGPSFSNASIEEELTSLGAEFEKLEPKKLIEQTAGRIADGAAIGWMQGRMEFGPRALGARSILADPRSDVMQRTLNLKVKYRESFRPFAPSVLFDHVSDWFDIDVPSPYMLMVADIHPDRQRQMSADEKTLFGIDKLNLVRSELPAVTHVDYSARIQTVHAHTNKRYYALIEKFYEMTGCPVVINTSFNVRGEPIVRTPADAYRCFMGTGLDCLVIGDFFLHKKDQPTSLLKNYRDKYKLD